MRRLALAWPDEELLAERAWRPIRLLAVSDDVDPALEDERTRASIAPVDLIVGCGDLPPDNLALLADAFAAPLVFVRGNHDVGEAWEVGATSLPDSLDGRMCRVAGLSVVGLGWPTVGRPGARRDEGRARRQVAGAMTRLLRDRLMVGRRPFVVASHAPPAGAGDLVADAYHRGFGAYRRLASLLRPTLWLHGHTPPAALPPSAVQLEETLVVNATGAVVIDLVAADELPGGA